MTAQPFSTLLIFREKDAKRREKIFHDTKQCGEDYINHGVIFIFTPSLLFISLHWSFTDKLQKIT